MPTELFCDGIEDCSDGSDEAEGNQTRVVKRDKFLNALTPTLIAFTGVTNVHGPSPQPTACRSPPCSLTTAKVSNED